MHVVHGRKLVLVSRCVMKHKKVGHLKKICQCCCTTYHSNLIFCTIYCEAIYKNIDIIWIPICSSRLPFWLLELLKAWFLWEVHVLVFFILFRKFSELTYRHTLWLKLLFSSCFPKQNQHFYWTQEWAKQYWTLLYYIINERSRFDYHRIELWGKMERINL